MAISPNIINEAFRFSKNYVFLKSGIPLGKPIIHTVQFGSESTLYLGEQI